MIMYPVNTFTNVPCSIIITNCMAIVTGGRKRTCVPSLKWSCLRTWFCHLDPQPGHTCFWYDQSVLNTLLRHFIEVRNRRPTEVFASKCTHVYFERGECCADPPLGCDVDDSLSDTNILALQNSSSHKH
jgi:hypothetical protein